MTELIDLVLNGLWETLYMTLASTAVAYIIGLPLGLLLTVTNAEGIKPNAAVNGALGAIVNVLRSVPFLILLVALVPVTRFIIGTAIGSEAMIVPLVIAAAPFVARMVESSAKEVDRGVVEASQAMGASNWQIVWRVIVPEAMPSLINGAAIAITTILGYSAMAGIVGGGGLGGIAINYGYYRQDSQIMMIMIVILVIVVQIFQMLGTTSSRLSDRRIR